MPISLSNEQRREEILSSAKTLFASRGYHGTGMSDIAAAVGIKAPSLYNHIDSKQSLLREIMLETMDTLLAAQQAAAATAAGPAEQLRRSMETHVRYHARHPRESRIGNSEIASLEQPYRDLVVEKRRRYVTAWEKIVHEGVASGVFQTASVQLSVFAMLEMGIGVSLWFRPDGPLTEDEVAYTYADMALKLVAV